MHISSFNTSTLQSISLGDAQKNNLSGKEITTAYLAQFEKQMIDASLSQNTTQASLFKMAQLNISIQTPEGFTPEEANALISEDGFFGIAQTSKRIADFVIQGAGDNLSTLQAGRSGILEGFKQAESMWGEKLPEISYTTLEKALASVDSRIATLGGNVLNTSA